MNRAAPQVELSGRRRLVWRTAAAAALLLAAAGAYAWYRVTAPVPPAIALEGTDPAVAKIIEEARAGVVRAPRSAAAWGRLGMLLAVHDFAPEARAALAQAERLDPREPRWPYLAGLVTLGQDLEAATLLFRRAVSLWGDSYDPARLRLAEVLLWQGQLDEAEQHFRHVLARAPREPRALLGLARLAGERNDLQGARALLGQLPASPNCNRASRVLLTEIRQRLGDRAGAEQAEREATAFPEDLPWPDAVGDEYLDLRVGENVELARVAQLLRDEQVADALAEVEWTAQRYPRSGSAQLLWGRVLLKQGQVPAAEAAIRRALQLAPELVEAHFYLGVVLYLKQDDRGAAVAFRRAIELQPSYGLAYFNLGHCLRRQGDRAGALEAFRWAVRCRPPREEAEMSLGELLAEEGQAAEAITHLRQALALNPENRTARQLLDRLSRDHGTGPPP
jgi:tetratricopeptide (TPR) repeat protein